MLCSHLGKVFSPDRRVTCLNCGNEVLLRTTDYMGENGAGRVGARRPKSDKFRVKSDCADLGKYEFLPSRWLHRSSQAKQPIPELNLEEKEAFLCVKRSFFRTK